MKNCTCIIRPEVTIGEIPSSINVPIIKETCFFRHFMEAATIVHKYINVILEFESSFVGASISKISVYNAINLYFSLYQSSYKNTYMNNSNFICKFKNVALLEILSTISSWSVHIQIQSRTWTISVHGIWIHNNPLKSVIVNFKCIFPNFI